MKKNKKIIIIVGVIIGLLVIGIVVFLIFKKNIFTTIDTSVKNSNSEYKISDLVKMDILINGDAKRK